MLVKLSSHYQRFKYLYDKNTNLQKHIHKSCIDYMVFKQIYFIITSAKIILKFIFFVIFVISIFYFELFILNTFIVLFNMVQCEMIIFFRDYSINVV